MELSKGPNAPIPVGEMLVAVQAPVAADIAAVLVTAAGKVRSDSDFVFYNQPVAPGVEVRPPDAIRVVTGAVPAEIEKVVVTVSLDGSGPANWGLVGPFRIVVNAAGTGESLAVFVPTGLGAETALIACELYRRRGAWKVRAVGQVYVQGLAGIATDFGISVDDDPEGRSADGAVEGFQADPLAAPTVTSSTPDASVRHGAPDHPAHPTEQPARFGTPTIDLSKGRVVLRKKQTVSLTTRDAPPLSRVRMGLGWDPAVHGHNIDLDASVIAYDARGKKLINVWFMRQQAFGGAIRHSGDNLTGHGEGDDEVISVDLPALPGEVHALVFTVNSFAGHKFNQVGRAYCRLVDDVGGAELVRFELSQGEPTTGVFLCMLTRAPHGWNMTALGEYAKGATVRKMVDPGKRFVLASR